MIDDAFAVLTKPNISSFTNASKIVIEKFFEKHIHCSKTKKVLKADVCSFLSNVICLLENCTTFLGAFLIRISKEQNNPMGTLIFALMFSLNLTDRRDCQVGDINLSISSLKVNFVIEALQLSESCDCFGDRGITYLHKRSTNNVLVVENDNNSYTARKKIFFDDKTEDIPLGTQLLPSSFFFLRLDELEER